jgi:hypothetical protein
MEEKDLTNLLLNQIEKRDKALESMINNINISIETFNITLRRQLMVCLITMAVIMSIFFIGYFFSDYDKTTSNYNENKNINESIGGAE